MKFGHGMAYFVSYFFGPMFLGNAIPHFAARTIALEAPLVPATSALTDSLVGGHIARDECQPPDLCLVER